MNEIFFLASIAIESWPLIDYQQMNWTRNENIFVIHKNEPRKNLFCIERHKPPSFHLISTQKAVNNSKICFSNDWNKKKSFPGFNSIMIIIKEGFVISFNLLPSIHNNFWCFPLSSRSQFHLFAEGWFSRVSQMSINRVESLRISVKWILNYSWNKIWKIFRL